MPHDPLFHPRVIKKALKTAKILNNGEIPLRHRKVLEGWNRNIRDHSIDTQTEGNLHPDFYSNLFGTVLGYTRFSNKNKRTGIWTLQNETKVKGTGRADIGLGKFSEKDTLLIAPLELKSPNTSNLDIAMHGRKESAVAQAQRYARNSQAQAKWYLVSNCIEIRLYKYPFSDSLYQVWQIEDLIKPAVYAEFILILAAKNFLSVKTERLFNHSLLIEKEISNQLYDDYRTIRIKLINGLKRENNYLHRKRMVSLTQTLLDRVLFIAYAEDCDLLPDKTLHNYLSKSNELQSSWDMLKLLFSHIDLGNPRNQIPKYNGDLFKPHSQLEALNISDELLNELEQLWEYDFDSDVSVTILGHIFEQSIADLDQIYESINDENELEISQKHHGTTGKRKKDGVVYTPDFITEWIVKHTFDAYLKQSQSAIKYEVDTLAWWQAYRDKLATTRICDPACGSGAFLVAAFKYLKKEFKQINTRLDELGEKGDLFSKSLNDDILNNNLFGVDLNSESVEIARLSLWLVTAEKGKPLTSLKENIKQGNSIVNHKNSDKNAFRWSIEGFIEFDIVLGNPPYVRQEQLSSIKAYLERYYNNTYHGMADLYTYFFELGLKILKKGGHLGYISSSTFFKTGSGANLRQHLSIQANLNTIVDFGDLQIFKGVTTYPAILLMTKPSQVRKNPPKYQYIKFWNVLSKKLDDFNTEMQKPKWGAMPQAKLANDGWRLEDEKLLALRQKIIKNNKTLKEVYGQPLYGIKTGLNAAFVISNETYNQIVNQDPLSFDRLKPFLEGKDLKKWHSETRQLYLILFPKGWTRQTMKRSPNDKITEEEAWTWLKSRYTKICNWLEPFSERGRKRGDKGEFWWELRSCSYYKNFKERKIMYAHFQSTPLYYIDNIDFYCNNKVYIIPKGDSYLLGYLNSNISWFIFTAMTTMVRGGYYEATTQNINLLPIPKSTDKQKEIISSLSKESQDLAEKRYELENYFRLDIPKLCPDNKEAKLNNKLKSWWLLSFEDFEREIKKQFKYELNRDQTREWRKNFNNDKQKCQQFSSQLALCEYELNQQIYTIFSLTSEEIQLLENNI